MQDGPSIYPQSQDPILEEMLRRLTGAFQPERVYLFGSRARGEAGPDSDYGIDASKKHFAHCSVSEPPRMFLC